MNRFSNCLKGTPDESKRDNGASSHLRVAGGTDRLTLSNNFKTNRASVYPGSSRPPSTISSKNQQKAYIVKDKRDFNNKEYMNTMIRNLIDFLSSIGKGQNYTEETLLNPKSRKDFEQVFEIICQFFDPKYKFPTIDGFNEVKSIFQSVGYPFPLKESTWKSITATHSWKIMLGALDWLRQCAMYAKAHEYKYFFAQYRERRSLIFPTEELNEMIFVVNAKCFNRHQSDNNDFTELENKFRNSLQASYSENGNLEELAAKNRQFENELMTLQTKLAENNSLPDEIHALELRAKKLKDYSNDLKEYRTTKLLPTIKAANEETLHLEEKLKNIKEEIVKNESIVANQKISQSEVKELMSTRQRLKMELSVQNEEIENLESSNNQQAMQISNQSVTVASKIEKFKSNARCLMQKMGLDQSWDEYLSFSYSPTDPKVKKLCKEFFRPALDVAKEKCDKLNAESESEIKMLKETLESIQESNAAADREISSMNEKINEYEKKIIELKDNNNPALVAKRQELERLKSTCEQYEQISRLDLATKKEKLDHLKKEYDAKKLTCQREAGEMAECLQSMAEILLDKKQKFEDVKMDHKERIERAMKQINKEEKEMENGKMPDDRENNTVK